MSKTVSWCWTYVVWSRKFFTKSQRSFHMNSLVFACLCCFASKYCAHTKNYLRVGEYFYFPQTFWRLPCKWNRGRAGNGNMERVALHTNWDALQGLLAWKMKASSCAFWPWGSREDAESASLTFQPAFSVHFNRYSWYTPNIWLGTSAKNAEISKAKQKKHIRKLNCNDPLPFKLPTSPHPFRHNLIEVRLPIVADLQRHTPSIFERKREGFMSQRCSIVYWKWERECFPKISIWPFFGILICQRTAKGNMNSKPSKLLHPSKNCFPKWGMEDEQLFSFLSICKHILESKSNTLTTKLNKTGWNTLTLQLISKKKYTSIPMSFQTSSSKKKQGLPAKTGSPQTNQPLDTSRLDQSCPVLRQKFRNTWRLFSYNPPEVSQ